jgi:hypothetical protein
MSKPTDTLRVVIPLTIRRRNGRPKVLPPESVIAREARAQDPHILKALGRAWAWRRKLGRGEMATAGDIAKAEGVTDRFVSRTMRLAYLSPEVLERMLVEREPPAVSVVELIAATYMPWELQSKPIFLRIEDTVCPAHQPPT